jgi:DNA-binding CsgD family transcriptional regulator
MTRLQCRRSERERCSLLGHAQARQAEAPSAGEARGGAGDIQLARRCHVDPARGIGAQPNRAGAGRRQCAHAHETRVAALVASGRTNREVAAELFLSVKTVEANLSRVYAKLSVRSRTELAARLCGAAAGQCHQVEAGALSFFNTSMSGVCGSHG